MRTFPMIKVNKCVSQYFYLKFLTADLHSWVFESDQTLPAPLALIQTFLESLLKKKGDVFSKL